MQNSKHRVLLVDDEPDIIEFIRYNLVKEDFEVVTAVNGKDAIAKARDFKPDVILLDVMMPEMDGVETCIEIKKIESLKHTMIAFLTARGEDYSQIAGFDAGADDYITKPIKPRVLISRLKALIRRNATTTQTGSDALETIAGISVDRERYVVVKDGIELTLPKKEFELLALLMSTPGKVFTR